MSVEQTVRDFWATRPRRRGDDRKLAGVAAAIGRRYRIDPVLVRVGLVVATVFSGVGVLLYLLGWLLLPAEGDEASAAESVLGKGRSSVSTALTVILGLGLILAGGAVFGGDPRGLITLALCGAALFVLHRHRASLGEVPTAPIATDAPENRTFPPAWDPLGAAPFAWDLPEPGPAPPQQPPPRRPRSKLTPVTLGLALLAGGIAAAFLPAIEPGHVAAIMLAVVGLGLLVGSRVHRGRGLIVAAVPLALVIWVLHAVPLDGFSAGERQWRAETPGQLLDRYTLTLGSGQLNLTGLTVPDGRTVSTTVAVSLGETKVFLPPDLDVDVTCSANTGNVHCLGEESGGRPRVQASDDGADGPGGGKLVLDVRADAGDVEVVRRG